MDESFFKKFNPTDDQLKTYLENSARDLFIAEGDSFPEVRFSFAYQALIKAGIALLKRNLDLYEGGTILSEKEIDTYIAFVRKVLRRVEQIIKK